MRYHAHALAANGVDVDLVGLEGTPLPREITDEPRITVHRLPIPRLKIRGELTGSTYAVAGLFDAFRISFRLWRTLRTLRRPELVLVQNPPAFPTLAVTWFTLRHKGVRFVIDWHNLGYTLLQLRLGQWHPAVRLARWYERRDARRADANLCVSRGLAAFLESRFGVKQATVLYDRPASTFTPIDRGERERFRQALFARLGIRASTVGFIVCPTSWTEDEDFDVVIEAVMRLEERIRGWEAGNSTRRFPELVILVTGDGARRAEFERRFAGLPARRIQLRARFLEPEDYPRVVGSADLGLCLHRSSSGLDIPDEDRRPVRRRRAGLRPGLRRMPRRAGASRRQRPAVLERAPARRRPLRSVRNLPGGSEGARTAAHGRPQARASHVGRRLDP